MSGLISFIASSSISLRKHLTKKWCTPIEFELLYLFYLFVISKLSI